MSTAVSTTTGAHVDVPLSEPWTRTRALLTSVLIFSVLGAIWGLYRVDLSIAALIEGSEQVSSLVQRMLPLYLPAEDIPKVIRAVVDTFFMAVLGTTIAVVLSIPIGLLSARNIAPNPFVRGVARGITAMARAVPALVLALIFVRVFSIGVLPGVLALGLHSIGFCAKLFADAAENIDVGQREGVAATGASRLQELVSGVWAQMVPAVIATSLYRLEINFRSATLLGYVGAGGVGLIIKGYQGNLRYPELLSVTVFIVIMVIAMEALSSFARQTLLGSGDTIADPRRFSILRMFGKGKTDDQKKAAKKAEDRVVAQATNPLRQPWTKDRIKLNIFGWTTAVLVVLGFYIPKISVVKFFQSVWEVPLIAFRMVPRDMSWLTSRVISDLIETVAIGAAATAIAMVFAIPTAFLAASNTAPGKWVHGITRLFMVVVRAMPELIIAVIFVAAIGLGPRAGTLALAIGMYGFSTRLFSDAIEEARQGPRDGVLATGATRMQETVTAVTPQVLPALIGQALYVFDVSLRSSTVLGMVGGGGIGFLLANAMKTLKFEVVGGIILCIFVIVFAIEMLTSWVRKQIL